LKVLTYTLFISFLSLISLNGQRIFHLDSIYTYPELIEMLNDARKTKDQYLLASIYSRMAHYEGNVLADYEKSIEYFRRAYEYYKLTNNTNQLHETNLSIASIYIEAGLYSDAIDILNKLVKPYEKNQTKLATVYFSLNRAHKGRGDYEMSIEFLRRANVINQSIKDPNLTSQILFDKINTFELGFELDSALVSAFEAFNLNAANKKYSDVAKSLFHIGYINKLKKDYPKALKYLTKSEAILPFEPYSNMRKMIFKELSDVYSKIENPQTAYKYLQRYTLLNDSILNKNRTESYTNLALKYGSQDKQSSIAVLTIDKQYAEEQNKAQRRALYVLGGVLALILAGIYFIIKFYDQRITTTRIITEQKEEINQQQIRELEDNIKMSSMRSVIEGQETERERIAKDLHDSLGGLLSTIKLKFENLGVQRDLNNVSEFVKGRELLDSAVSEVRTISRNLQPSSLVNLGLVAAIKDLINRFETGAPPEIEFQYYEIPSKMDKMISLSIYRIIQELLTNSLKHAQANEILLQLNTDGDEIVIQYEDDGIGFDESSITKKGMGLENIHSRVNYLHGSITFDSARGHGVSVLIRLKYDV
jgi:two-component system NarL family sensor kinase